MTVRGRILPPAQAFVSEPRRGLRPRRRQPAVSNETLINQRFIRTLREDAQKIALERRFAPAIFARETLNQCFPYFSSRDCRYFGSLMESRIWSAIFTFPRLSTFSQIWIRIWESIDILSMPGQIFFRSRRFF